jgi:hypothetical protein
MFRHILCATSSFLLVREDRDTILLHFLKHNCSIPFYSISEEALIKIISVIEQI